MRFATASALLLASLLSAAQSPKTPPSASDSSSVQWMKLIHAKRITEADKLCTAWVNSADLIQQVEAQKCLANVALSKGERTTLQRNEAGAGTLGVGYKPEAVDEALQHLNEGLRLAPQDRTIHQARLQILETAGRFDVLDQALEESVDLYKGEDTPEIWIAYTFELANEGNPTAALDFAEILDKHYPNNPDIIGNLGALHNMQQRWDLGLPFVRHAVQLRPDDPIDTWNLGWTLSHLDQLEDAEHWMRVSIQMPTQDQSAQERRCLFGQFLVAKRANTTEGCKFVTVDCTRKNRMQCAPRRTLTPGR